VTGPPEVAVRLAEALAGPEPALRELLAEHSERSHAALREAATLITEAAGDPVGFAALHGDDLWQALRVDASGLDRMRRVFRRDDALEALYAADQSGSDPAVDDLGEGAAEMAAGVWGERDVLDAAIGAAAEGWRVERMAPVDRNVIRLALWELRHRPETPVAVVVSEAVRLAKAYSTGQSGRFVNGVLAGLASIERPGGR
jgi:N utilization substance protein B